MAQTTINSFFSGAVRIKQEPGTENNNENESTSISNPAEFKVKDEPKSPDHNDTTDTDTTVEYQINPDDVKMEEDYPDSNDETEDEADHQNDEPNIKMEPDENVSSDGETIPDEQMDTDIDAPINPVKLERMSPSKDDDDIASIHARYNNASIPSTSKQNNIDEDDDIAALYERYADPSIPSTSHDAYKRKNEHSNEYCENLAKKSKPNDNYDLFETVEKSIEQTMHNSKLSIDDNDQIKLNAKRTSRFCVNQTNADDENLDQLIELKDLVEAHLAEEEKSDKELLNQTDKRLKELMTNKNVDRSEITTILQQIDELQKKQKQREADKIFDNLEKEKLEKRKNASIYLEKIFNDFDFDKFDELNELKIEPKIENTKYRDFYANVMNINVDDDDDDANIIDNKTQRVLKHLVKGKCESQVPEVITLLVKKKREKIMKCVGKHLQPYLIKNTINKKLYDVIAGNTVEHFEDLTCDGKSMKIKKNYSSK